MYGAHTTSLKTNAKMIELFYALGGLGGLAILIWVVRSIKRWGASEHKLNQAVKDKDHANKEAKKWSNARTVSTVVRLRDHAKRKRDS